VSGGTPIFLPAAALFLCRKPPRMHGQVSPSSIGLGECPRSHEPSGLELLEDLARPEERGACPRREIGCIAGALLQHVQQAHAQDGRPSTLAAGFERGARGHAHGHPAASALDATRVRVSSPWLVRRDGAAPWLMRAYACSAGGGFGRQPQNTRGVRSHCSLSSCRRWIRGHVVLARDSVPPPLADMCRGCSAEPGRDNGLTDLSTELLPAGEIVDSPGPVSQIA
jgi:hypothetical protein